MTNDKERFAGVYKRERGKESEGMREREREREREICVDNFVNTCIFGKGS